jgi:hypothetical protein
MTSPGTKDQSGQKLKECTEELQMGVFNKKDRKRKISFLEDSNIDSVLAESRVCCEEETEEKGESIFPRRDIDKVQALHERDCTPKKRKKKKRRTKESHSTEENKNASESQCEGELETVEKGSSGIGNEIPSKGREETGAEELYETLVAEADDIDTELSFQVREV